MYIDGMRGGGGKRSETLHVTGGLALPSSTRPRSRLARNPDVTIAMASLLDSACTRKVAHG